MEEEYIIRGIEAADNKAVATLIRAVFEEYDAPRQGTVFSDPTTDNLYTLFNEKRSIFWLAVQHGKILGCCGIYPTPGLPPHCAELVKFYLSKNARGKGIGKALMQKSITSAKEMGYKELYIESIPVYADAVRIYENNGFQHLQHPLGNSGHTSCNIWMLTKLE